MAENVDAGMMEEPPRKIRRAIQCSICHKEGHNKAKCPQNPNAGQKRLPRRLQAVTSQQGNLAYIFAIFKFVYSS